LGRLDDATTLYAESVEILRKTYPNDPYRQATVLATALINYAQQLMRADHTEEAVAAAQEAVDLCRAAREENPNELTKELAYGLRNLTIALHKLNRYEEAVDTGKRAVSVARRVARENPHQASILAETLGQLAYAQRAGGAYDDAVETAREAVDAARSLVAGLRPGERRDLARRLEVLSDVLWSENSAEAVDVAAEAVEVWRAVAVAYPVYRRNLALALSWLAEQERQHRVGDLGSACAEEAEAIARDIAADHPERGRPVLDEVLPRVARVLDAVGEPERARAIREEIDARE
jgi:tetratricopeptide (TPR) repeat protein